MQRSRHFLPALALLAAMAAWPDAGAAQQHSPDTGLAGQHTSAPAPEAAPEGPADRQPRSVQGLLERVRRALYAVENWLVVGLVLLIGRLGGRASSRLRAPMVVGYLLVGVLLGRSLLNIISIESTERLELVTDLGLGLVAFMIGTELSRRVIRRLGRKLIVIMVSESVMAFIVVAGLVWGLASWLLPAAGLAVAGALILGAMAPASAPAGTVAVIQEYKARGPLTTLLLGVVGLDDAFAIMIYAFAAAIAKVVLSAKHVTFSSVIAGPCLEILGGLAVGAAVGVVLHSLVRRSRDRPDVLVYTLGAILLATGLANAMGLSLILANLAVGAVVANISTRAAERAYRAVEQITAPIYALFFVVAGAHLDLRLFAALGLLGLVYILGRSAGLIGGAWLGASLSGAEPNVRRYLGLGILSQAGVAVGLALTVANEFRAPEYGPLGKQLAELTINTIAATTIVFEILGPITTKIALSKAGEIGQVKQTPGEAS